MKRIITVISAIVWLGGFTMQAVPVTPERALEIGKRILSAQPATKAGTGQVSIVWDGTFADEPATKAESPAFYVVARDGGGFVIVAGDDNVVPVLALSDRNEFKIEGMPENVRWWMESIKEYVRNHHEQSPEVAALWEKYLPTKNASIPAEYVTPTVTRFTPEWDQGNNDVSKFGVNIFNAKCPMIGSDYCVTGCVAVALGEVLTYQSGLYDENMPTHSTGSVTADGYNLDTGISGGIRATLPYYLGTTYNWNDLRSLSNRASIQDAINHNETTKLENLAQLLADLGAMMRATYSVSETSASTSRIPYRLAEHLYYNKAAYYDEASNYSDREWVAKLKTELNARPLIFSGRSEYGGHAFVLDGYGVLTGYDYDMFHVNFGWGGIDNGYYLLTNLTTTSNGNYAHYCGAVFDFYPDPDPATSQYPVKLEAYHYYDSENHVDYPGVRAEEHSEYPGLYLFYYCVYNKGNAPYNGEIKFGILRKNNTLEYPTSGYYSTTIDVNPNSIIYAYRGYATIDSSFGDRIVCCYKDGDEWKILPGPVGTAIAEWPLMPATFIKTEATYSQNDYFSFELMNNDYLYAGTVWTITDPDGTSVVKQQSDKEFQLTMSGTYKIQAAVAEKVGDPLKETIVTYITVAP